MTFYEKHKKKIWLFVGFAIAALILGTVVNGIEPTSFNQ